MEKYGYIYITENLIDGHKYIGQHRAEKFEPEKYIGSGKLMERAIKKYGKENFKCELLEWCESEQSLNEREIYWIAHYNAVEDPNFYNLALGGFKILNYKSIICIETQKIFKSVDEAILFTKGGDVTAVLKNQQSTAGGYHWAYLEDIQRQEELKEFIDKPPKPNYNYIEKKNLEIICIETQEIFKVASPYINGMLWSEIRNCCLGKSRTSYGYHWAFSNDYKRLENLKGYIGKPRKLINRKKIIPIGPNKKAIKCVETGEIFKSISEAQHWLGKGWITGVVDGSQKTAGGYHWELINLNQEE